MVSILSAGVSHGPQAHAIASTGSSPEKGAPPPGLWPSEPPPTQWSAPAPVSPSPAQNGTRGSPPDRESASTPVSSPDSFDGGGMPHNGPNMTSTAAPESPSSPEDPTADVRMSLNEWGLQERGLQHSNGTAAGPDPPIHHSRHSSSSSSGDSVEARSATIETRCVIADVGAQPDWGTHSKGLLSRGGCSATFEMGVAICTGHKRSRNAVHLSSDRYWFTAGTGFARWRVIRLN